MKKSNQFRKFSTNESDSVTESIIESPSIIINNNINSVQLDIDDLHDCDINKRNIDNFRLCLVELINEKAKTLITDDVNYFKHFVLLTLSTRIDNTNECIVIKGEYELIDNLHIMFNYCNNIRLNMINLQDGNHIMNNNGQISTHLIKNVNSLDLINENYQIIFNFYNELNKQLEILLLDELHISMDEFWNVIKFSWGISDYMDFFDYEEFDFDELKEIINQLDDNNKNNKLQIAEILVRARGHYDHHVDI